jgi:predicted dehydrogenase
MGKHAFVEVSAAVTVDECWQLVDASEKYQRHCSILENCCYGEEELFVLHMARQGLFGDLKHAECAYIHDLGKGVLWALGSEGDWRRNYHTFMDGNLYPTHGLGPVAQYLNIGRGDAFKFVVSVSSPEFNLTQFRDKAQPNKGRHKDEKYVCGDMNTSIIKTQLGRTIMIQHDVVSPRPYSRINGLCGTEATFFGYPARLAIDAGNKHPLLDPKEKRNSHEWTYEKEKLSKFMQANRHPLVTKVGELAKKVGGHGGMDFILNYRMLDCVRQGITPDMTVYDAADWSAILELSARSVKDGSMPVQCPDFTRGGWKDIKPLGIVS